MLRKRRTGARLSGVLAITTLLAVAASGHAIAQPGNKKVAHKKQSVSSTVSGQQVSVDPATGRLQQPTPEEAKQMTSELSAMLQRSVENLDAITLPNGTMMVDLDGGFQNVTMASFDADGQLVLTCVDDLQSAETVLQLGAVSLVAPRVQVQEAVKKGRSKHAPVRNKKGRP